MLTADVAGIDLNNVAIVDRSIINANMNAAGGVGNSTFKSVIVPNTGFKLTDSIPYYVGDPPPNQRQWIGDPPIDFQPNPYIPVTVPYIPYEPPYVPPTMPDWSKLVQTITTSGAQPVVWRQTAVGNTIKLSLDVPGVRISDATVEIENGTLKFSGKRFDTGEQLMHSHYVGHDYDPETADAVIDSGVLTVTIERFKSKRVHKVALRDA